MPKLIVQARVPTPVTLKRYGLTAAEWKAICKSQGGVCAICRKLPPSRILCVDHYHCRGWKKLSPAERKETVRGLACGHCNHVLLGYLMTLAKARAVVQYLEAFETRTTANQERKNGEEKSVGIARR